MEAKKFFLGKVKIRRTQCVKVNTKLLKTSTKQKLVIHKQRPIHRSNQLHQQILNHSIYVSEKQIFSFWNVLINMMTQSQIIICRTVNKHWRQIMGSNVKSPTKI